MTLFMSTEETLEDIDTKRKRLIFRSWHRGTREMDLILGSFADLYVPEFSAQDLTLYDEILHHSDPDLYNWISGKEDTPANYRNPVMDKLLAHNYNKH